MEYECTKAVPPPAQQLFLPRKKSSTLFHQAKLTAESSLTVNQYVSQFLKGEARPVTLNFAMRASVVSSAIKFAW